MIASHFIGKIKLQSITKSKKYIFNLTYFDNII